MITVEHERLAACRDRGVPWKKWGPYLSERQWGTVREDYSDDGTAWDYFPHDHARSRAYRWGEDGLAGISDDQQLLCFALALWNGRDPILKERLFGLTNGEGNHGEDVKEYYFYLDSTPTHSYMKYLYKYPQAAYPYSALVDTNRRRSRARIRVRAARYGRVRRRPVLRRIRRVRQGRARGRPGPDHHLQPRTGGGALCTCSRRSGFATPGRGVAGRQKPGLQAVDAAGATVIRARHVAPPSRDPLADYFLYCEGEVPLLFTENETNRQRLLEGAQPEPLREGRHQRLPGPRPGGRRESRRERDRKRQRTISSISAPGLPVDSAAA